MTDVARLAGTLLVVGGGRMGEAIVAGLIGAGAAGPEQIVIAEPGQLRREQLSAAYGVRTVASASEAVPSDIVLLAVKPQVIDAVVGELSAALANSLVVSIAAGITCARLESVLPAGTAVVRVMPNTPAMVGEGMALVSGGAEADAEQVETVAAMFAALGRAVTIEERYQDAGTAISGCGPAYFALVVEALSRAGVAQGLTRETAQALAVQTMRGTAALLEETGMHPEVLIDGVTSPGGSTIAAVAELESGGVRAAFNSAVAAAVKRSKELGS